MKEVAPKSTLRTFVGNVKTKIVDCPLDPDREIMVLEHLLESMATASVLKFITVAGRLPVSESKMNAGP